MNLDQIRQLLRPIATQVANTVARAIIKYADDSKQRQLVQIGVQKGETLDHVPHYQPYGFSSVPLAGAEGVALFQNGNRARPIIFAVDDRRYRPTDGDPGDVGLYHYQGARVTLPEGGNIVSTPKTGSKVKLGSSAANKPPALATELAALKSAIATWAPVAGDGGASLKAIFAAWATPGATKVDVE